MPLHFYLLLRSRWSTSAINLTSWPQHILVFAAPGFQHEEGFTLALVSDSIVEELGVLSSANSFLHRVFTAPVLDAESIQLVVTPGKRRTSSDSLEEVRSSPVELDSTSPAVPDAIEDSHFSSELTTIGSSQPGLDGGNATPRNEEPIETPSTHDAESSDQVSAARSQEPSVAPCQADTEEGHLPMVEEGALSKSPQSSSGSNECMQATLAGAVYPKPCQDSNDSPDTAMAEESVQSQVVDDHSLAAQASDPCQPCKDDVNSANIPMGDEKVQSPSIESSGQYSATPAIDMLKPCEDDTDATNIAGAVESVPSPSAQLAHADGRSSEAVGDADTANIPGTDESAQSPFVQVTTVNDQSAEAVSEDALQLCKDDVNDMAMAAESSQSPSAQIANCDGPSSEAVGEDALQPCKDDAEDAEMAMDIESTRSPYAVPPVTISSPQPTESRDVGASTDVSVAAESVSLPASPHSPDSSKLVVKPDVSSAVESAVNAEPATTMQAPTTPTAATHSSAAEDNQDAGYVTKSPSILDTPTIPLHDLPTFPAVAGMSGFAFSSVNITPNCSVPEFNDDDSDMETEAPWPPSTQPGYDKGPVKVSESEEMLLTPKPSSSAKSTPRTTSGRGRKRSRAARWSSAKRSKRSDCPTPSQGDSDSPTSEFASSLLFKACLSNYVYFCSKGVTV